MKIKINDVVTYLLEYDEQLKLIDISLEEFQDYKKKVEKESLPTGCTLSQLMIQFSGMTLIFDPVHLADP